MSVSILEVIESAGYTQDNRANCEWLLAQKESFEEALEAAEEFIENDDEPCTHENTSVETVENTADYEYNQSIGNTSYPLQQSEREFCDDCEAWRELPEGEWQDE